eukprot:s3128_g14.t1
MLRPRFQPPDFEGEDGQLPRSGLDDAVFESGQAEELEDLGPFSADTFVEYRSRSSGQWILAKARCSGAWQRIRVMGLGICCLGFGVVAA